jgi:hypothetical protein
MKKLILSSLAVLVGLQLFAQTTTLANFDFNGSVTTPTSTATNITASITGTESNAAY